MLIPCERPLGGGTVPWLLEGPGRGSAAPTLASGMCSQHPSVLSSGALKHSQEMWGLMAFPRHFPVFSLHQEGKGKSERGRRGKEPEASLQGSGNRTSQFRTTHQRAYLYLTRMLLECPVAATEAALPARLPQQAAPWAREGASGKRVSFQVLSVDACPLPPQKYPSLRSS